MSTGLLTTADVARKAGLSHSQTRFILTSRNMQPAAWENTGRPVYLVSVVTRVKRVRERMVKRMARRAHP
jgi:hypothetical protein